MIFSRDLMRISHHLAESEAAMRRRRLGMLALLGLSTWGCGPAEIVPMTPPGVPYHRVVAEGMEAEGESKNRSGVRPTTAPDGTKPTINTGVNPVAPPQGAK
jgi:hypothetical protein